MRSSAPHTPSRATLPVRHPSAAYLLAAVLMVGCESPPSEPPPPSPESRPTTEESPYFDGELLVRFRGGVQALATSGADVVKGASVLHAYRGAPGLQHVRLPVGLSVERALEQYRADPRVEFAEPNYRLEKNAQPDDTRFREQWGLHNVGQTLGVVDADINAPEAWELVEGRESGVVAVIDTGVDLTHPDLVDNLWVNPGETAGNGIDDDNNGYIDDIHGIDATDAAGARPPRDDDGHGTHVAGIIAARGGNGRGVTGVSPRTKLIACRITDANGNLSGAAAIRCLDYVAELKTRTRHPVNVVATNSSWGGRLPSQELERAIARNLPAGILFVTAVGNTAMSLDENWGSQYPAEYSLPHLIRVGASDASDRRAWFSNFGPQRVDVFAPGEAILSTVPGGGYAAYSGTSMAAPHVAGLVALLSAQVPARDWRTLRNLVLSGGQQVPALRDVSVTGRRIRAIGTDGVGSMSCENQTVARRLAPQGEVFISGTSWGEPGDRVTLSALNIRCGEAAGRVTVLMSSPPGSIDLLDDGLGADLVAGDGIATAHWSPPETGAVTFTFPGEDAVTVHPRFPALPSIHKGRASWNPALGEVALFSIDFSGRGSPGPWEVQWDVDYKGRFDVDISTAAPGTSHPGEETNSSVRLVPQAPEATVAAVKLIDSLGVVSPTLQFLTDYQKPYPSDVRVDANILVPETSHPFELTVWFRANGTIGPWVVQWDLFHDGERFTPYAADLVLSTAGGEWPKAIGRLTRVFSASHGGPHRFAVRVMDAKGKTSPIQTWGAVAVCGPPFIQEVEWESAGRVEPVDARLTARAVQACEPILRYRWDFDADGSFDAESESPFIRHVYADNVTGQSSQRGIVRAETATTHFDRTFEVPVENTAPLVLPIPEQVVTTRQRMEYQVPAHDVAGDTLRFTLSANAPRWVQLSDTGRLSWTASESWARGEKPLGFSVTVTDDEGLSATIPVVLVPAYRPEPPPAPPDEGGCSTTVGAFPGGLVLLALLPWLQRRGPSRRPGRTREKKREPPETTARWTEGLWFTLSRCRGLTSVLPPPLSERM
ncbi:S8 family serine peptidase [Myxococcus sp. CA051A]|uniref:S8 family peptidase n=1 Tax=Myxococcus sp. CA051A TaxID=2741739 RepID=UPI00157AB741|nr:S8 family peptidase [Myxococcus sp. CA051A]NTX62918.1 S8 family serine peptidase [Myxococcus sp. CA051A]